MHEDEFSRLIIGTAIEVHRRMGPGLLESVYEECMACEFRMRGIPFERQKRIPLTYKGQKLDAKLRIDFFVGNMVVVELKAVENVAPVHDAQVLTYLKLTGSI